MKDFILTNKPALIRFLIFFAFLELITLSINYYFISFNDCFLSNLNNETPISEYKGNLTICSIIGQNNICRNTSIETFINISTTTCIIINSKPFMYMEFPYYAFLIVIALHTWCFSLVFNAFIYNMYIKRYYRNYQYALDTLLNKSNISYLD